MRTPTSRSLSQTCDIFSPSTANNALGEVVFTYSATPSHDGVRCSLQLDSASESRDLGGETLEESGTLYLDVLDGSGSSIPVQIADRISLEGESRTYEAVGRGVIAAGHQNIQSVRVKRVGSQR